VIAVLLGGGGLLGSGFQEALAGRPGPPVRLSPPWGDVRAVGEHLAQTLPPLLDGAGDALVVWAAGAGHVGAGDAAMATETAAVQALARVVAGLPADRRERLTLLFASSAGALFGGHGAAIVGDDSEPAPITAYGREKLAQVHALRELAADAGCRVVACRYANLHGMAGGRLPARGLLPAAIRATRLRQPMTVYVSPDTRRDMLYNRDAAAISLAVTAAAPPGFSTALVREGRTRTIGEVLALVRAVSRRRVPVTYGQRPETRLQPKVLRFAPPTGVAASGPRTPLEVALHRMLRSPMD
jgi:UDP-glucose 4-epimerase